jgi:hypothetical protein
MEKIGVSNYIRDGMRKVKFEIDENSELQGVKTISLVDQPAIESDFIFFNKDKNQFIELKSENYKQVVAGLALIPNKYILRFDGLGQEYYGYFTADVIEKIRNKFHKEQLGSLVNTDHSSTNYVNAYLLESFIIDSEQRLQDVTARGIEGATMGSWFVAYKIEDAQTFQRVVSGELRGFSVEVFLQQFCKVDNNNEINYKEEMSNILEKLKQLLLEAEKQAEVTAPVQTAPVEEKKFDKGIADGVTYEYGTIGEPVNIVAEDGSTSAAPDGEYKLDNGKVLSVASGVATDIKDAPVEDQKKVEVAPVDNSELEKVKSELEKIKNELKLSKEEITKLKNAPVANPVTKKEVKVEQVDFSKMTNAERFIYEQKNRN